MSTPTPDSWLFDPALWIVTSLTAGSSHIVTATSRLETILRANRVPFKAVDIAVEDKARVLWSRRAGKDSKGRLRKLPGLVQDGMVLGVRWRWRFRVAGRCRCCSLHHYDYHPSIYRCQCLSCPAG